MFVLVGKKTKPESISFKERDRFLDLGSVGWPERIDIPIGWQRDDEGSLCRRIPKTEAWDRPIDLRESMLRFPSAPVHRLQRLHEDHVPLKSAEVFHSYRVLQAADAPPRAAKRTRRVFLMHNGLNELLSMRFHYQLASQLIDQDEDRATAFVLRPFPGHLTRFPFQAFAESPLDRYLVDGSQLFRQFVRFMIETQWLLSVLARRPSYKCPSGANLLAEAETVEGSRLVDEKLAEELEAAWGSLHKASKSGGSFPDGTTFKSAVTSLRRVLNLSGKFSCLDGSPDDDEPDVHVLGYSLGASTAEAVFMSWPFLIASCTTLQGGGPLRELALTAFAHPEEWQTVLHSLRYELDDRLMSPSLRATKKRIAGIDADLFAHFKRTFYEVFQQDYRGGFQTRVATFRSRMLFIVGGNDPIADPGRIRESAPPGGMNLLEVGGVGHFLGSRKQDQEEEQLQKHFWLPQVCAIIHRFVDETGRRHAEERAASWFDANVERPVAQEQREIEPLSQAETVAIEEEGALPGELFERYLDDLLWRIADAPGHGVLFILRNELPTIMLHPAAVRQRATAMYHDDRRIARYCRGIQERKRVCDKYGDHIGFVFPWNLGAITGTIDENPGYPSQSECSGGHVAKPFTVKQSLRASTRLLSDHVNSFGSNSVRVVDGRKRLDQYGNCVPDDLRTGKRASAGNEALHQLSTLPECWVWLSREFYGLDHSFRLEEGVEKLINTAGKIEDRELEKLIGHGHLRIVQISRARFNPRYRGRLLVTPADVGRLLVHVALCLAIAEKADDKKIRTLLLGRDDGRAPRKR